MGRIGVLLLFLFTLIAGGLHPGNPVHLLDLAPIAESFQESNDHDADEKDTGLHLPRDFINPSAIDRISVCVFLTFAVSFSFPKRITHFLKGARSRAPPSFLF